MHTATKHDQKSINTNAGAHSQQKQGREQTPALAFMPLRSWFVAAYM